MTTTDVFRAEVAIFVDAFLRIFFKKNISN
jgi:hypothetical protein